MEPVLYVKEHYGQEILSIDLHLAAQYDARTFVLKAEEPQIVVRAKQALSWIELPGSENNNSWEMLNKSNSLHSKTYL